MKKLFLFALLCLMALSMNAQVINVEGGTTIVVTSSGTVQVPSVNSEYVDLGLPSGTLWKSSNEKGGYYTYREAESKFGEGMPTREQWEELRKMCNWTWTGKGYKVTGENGRSITLPAAGYRGYRDSILDVGSCGYYWSSISYGWEHAWYLCIASSKVEERYIFQDYGLSVRLVR